MANLKIFIYFHFSRLDVQQDTFLLTRSQSRALTKKHQDYQGGAGIGPTDLIFIQYRSRRSPPFASNRFKLIIIRKMFHYDLFLLLRTAFYLLETTPPGCWYRPWMKLFYGKETFRNLKSAEALEEAISFVTSDAVFMNLLVKTIDVSKLKNTSKNGLFATLGLKKKLNS